MQWLVDLANTNPEVLALLVLLVLALVALASVGLAVKIVSSREKVVLADNEADSKQATNLSQALTTLAGTANTMAEQWGSAATEIRATTTAMRELATKFDTSLDQEKERIEFWRRDRGEQMTVQNQTVASLNGLRSELQIVAKSNREHTDKVVEELSARVDHNLEELRSAVLKEMQSHQTAMLLVISERLEEAWAGVRSEMRKLLTDRVA